MTPEGAPLLLSQNGQSAPPPDGSLIDFPVVIDVGSGSDPTITSDKHPILAAVKLDVHILATQGTPVLFYRAAPHDWRLVAHQRFVKGKLEATLTSLGYYQVFVPILNAPFAFSEVYVFPNPTSGKATLHVEVGKSDEVSTRIYDASGDIVYETRVDQQVIIVNGKPCYEVPLNTDSLKPGVYVGVVTAKKDGKETIRKRYRFTVLR